jgi:hypothetical protein
MKEVDLSKLTFKETMAYYKKRIEAMDRECKEI